MFQQAAVGAEVGAADVKRIAVPVPVRVLSIRHTQDVPDTEQPVRAARDVAAEHGADTDQRASRRLAHAGLSAARAAGPLHVPRGP